MDLIGSHSSSPYVYKYTTSKIVIIIIYYHVHITVPSDISLLRRPAALQLQQHTPDARIYVILYEYINIKYTRTIHVQLLGSWYTYISLDHIVVLGLNTYQNYMAYLSIHIYIYA